jgi:hypothetical protein
LRSFKWSSFTRLLHQTPYAPLLSPIRTTRPAHLILHALINRTIFGQAYRA